MPIGIKRIVEITDDTGYSDTEFHNDTNIADFEDSLLPLESNDQQTKIVKRLESRQGVLVQGPPGTGKSHTIVNLICHLLAKGKRVLVTSQTPRALKVLKRMIPKEVDALCVSLLGNDSSALEGLKDSVQGITNRQYDWDSNENQRKIAFYRDRVDKLRRKEAELSIRLREIREKETFSLRIGDGSYTGTAQRIAEQISSERSRHGWLDICVEPNIQSPLSDDKALELLYLHRELTPERIAEALKPLPPLEELPSPEEFIRKHQCELAAQAHFSAFEDVVDRELYSRLATLKLDELERPQNAFSRLLEARKDVIKHSQTWVRDAVQDILSENDRRWRQLLNLSKEYLEGLMNQAMAAEKRHIDIPEGYHRFKVIADARNLLAHLEGGKGFGFPFFRPKVVKEAWYLIKKTRVNGNLCDKVGVIKELLATLEVDERIDKLLRIWSPYAESISGTRPEQVGIVEDLCEPLQQAIELHPLLVHARDICAEISGLPQPAWHKAEEVELYHRSIQAAQAELSLKDARAAFDRAEQAIQICVGKCHDHPVLAEPLQKLRDRDENGYGEAHKKLVQLYSIRERMAQRSRLFERLAEHAPDIAEQIRTEAGSSEWDRRLAHFTDSWKWAEARTWLEDFVTKDDESEITSQLTETLRQIRKTTMELVAAMAWGHCFDRLKESERQHLKAWTLAMKRIGRGKGKRVEIHRSEARKNMDKCRGAIPAWIMPLYRVAETVEPGVDLYDVVIIDEASQSGPEALFLLFLAKRIVVVGDNEQINPEHVGIPKDDVDALRNRYITDLPHQAALGVEESSIFDLADIIFSERSVLQEHFRCMPEIIEFSNRLCYTHAPLEPLRQYLPDRLEPPVVTVHVEGGYREGDQPAARNLPEAEAVVKKISECCNDPRYNGKSMGVISLLGGHQPRLIERMLLDKIGPEEIERRKLVCGDAYVFQGDERDVMFLSMVAAPGETQMIALTRHSYKRRFNVAASRAKDQMWLFHTPTLNDFRNKECLRYRLLNYCQKPEVQVGSLDSLDFQQLKRMAMSVNRRKEELPSPFDSWFEVDVFLEIIDRGYQTRPQFNVAGYFIDMVVEGMRARLAVECDGDRWHDDPEQREKDMLRQRNLERCGWTFWRVRGSEYYVNPDRALESLWTELEKLGIAPGGKDITYDKSDYKKVAKLSRIEEDSHLPSEEVEETIPQTREDERLERALNWSRLRPTKRQGTEKTQRELQHAIVAVLKGFCPNMSCTKKSLTSKICRHLNYRSRGAPRVRFEKKLMRALNKLKAQQIVEEYKAKNVRIRLAKGPSQKILL